MTTTIQQVIEVVEAVEGAKSRIFVPEPVTFFSKNDYWLYIEISDDKLCAKCKANAQKHDGVYTGQHLRADFPRLDIRDANTIAVNEHPNCRCVLVRVKTVENWFA